jgi:hypothetical protein
MKTIQYDSKQIDKLNRKLLKNAMLDGAYELERLTDFWSQRDSTDCLAGERKAIGSGVMVTPLRYVTQSKGNACLLVCITDTKNRTWHAWIHA